MNKNEKLQKEKYKAIFFDFGDTLSFNNQSFVDGLSKVLMTLDISVPMDQLRAVISICDSGVLKEERLQARSKSDYYAFRLKYYSSVLKLIDYPQKDDCYPKILHEMMPYYHATYLKPETLLVLSALRQEGYKIGIVSNFDHSLPWICHELGIDEKVDFITYSDDLGIEKPLPYIFEDALEKAGVKPEETIHIGDSYVADIQGAKALGITPILITDTKTYRDCICIHNLIDILRLLNIENYKSITDDLA